MSARSALTRSLVVLAAVGSVVCGVLVGPPAAAEMRAGASVVGTWAVGFGQVKITGSGPSYTGVVSETVTGFLCQHPVGEHIWTLTGDGPSFGGQARFDFNTGCPGPMSTATFVLLSADLLQVNYVGPTGVSATLYLAMRVPGPSPGGDPGTGTEDDTTAPTVTAVQPSKFYKAGQRIPLSYRVSDDSGKARIMLTLFSDGAVVARGDTGKFVKAKGGVQTATMQNPLKATKDSRGPYYFCVTARDKAGNVSDVDCAWLSIQVPVSLLANGCGGAQFGEGAVSVQNWLLDTRKYNGSRVVFSRACDLHDAAYAGVTVADPFTKKVIDFRTWSRQKADDKFFDDLRYECRRYLVGEASDADVEACQNGMTVLDLAALAPAELVTPWVSILSVGAFSYYDAVRRFAAAAYDANATVDGSQDVMPTETIPDGGIRDNR
ncbi:MAG: hypothetical protein Q7V58_04550 [Actinomycetota bacterium]|nr:hypothetical protein [Actinomycetota bacterium]